MEKTGFIGMGNMGYAILKSLINENNKKYFGFIEKNKERALQVLNETGVECYEDSKLLLKDCKYIILAIKPQVFESVLKDIKSEVTDKHIIISIAAGVSISKIENVLETKRIVRAMPNAPALIAKGMTGISYDEKVFDAQEIKEIEGIFSSFGRFIKIDEKYIDAVVCVSGSSPAYAYMFIDALADTGVRYGLTKSDALVMAAQTLMGSAMTVLETQTHPCELKDRVCSPGGTTIAAVEKLEEYGFRNAVLKAGEACYKRCKEL